LTRRGYMTSASLKVIENGWYTYEYGCCDGGDIYGYVTEREVRTPKWVEFLWVPGLVGLALVIWLVGFGFRLPRRPRASRDNLV
jgi:hypothetical protein